MQVLTVDFEFIAQSMKDFTREKNDYYLDKNSGKLFVLSRDLIRSLVDDTRDERADLPAWDARLIPVAREIVLSGSSTYIRVPEAFGKPEHRWMADFSKDVRPIKLKERLMAAMRGRGACRRFKEILRDHPVEMKAWHDFCVRRWEEQIQSWLETVGIIAVNQNPKKVRSSAA